MAQRELPPQEADPEQGRREALLQRAKLSAAGVSASATALRDQCASASAEHASKVAADEGRIGQRPVGDLRLVQRAQVGQGGKPLQGQADGPRQPAALALAHPVDGGALGSPHRRGPACVQRQRHGQRDKAQAQCHETLGQPAPDIVALPAPGASPSAPKAQVEAAHDQR